MNNSVWKTLRPLQLTWFMSLTRATIFVAAVLVSAGASAQAQLGTNPVGSTVTLGSSDSYDNTSFVGDGDGYDNYGNVTVVGAQFDQNDYYGLQNEEGSSATIEAGTFDYNGYGAYNQGSTESIFGGNFDNNSYGVEDFATTDSISGGDFDNNAYGLSSIASTDSISGGTFDNNLVGLACGNSSCSISGGDFQGNSLYDLSAYNGTIDIYGESFGGLSFGDLAEGTGIFGWTLSNGTTEELSYYNGGTIDLIYAPATAPAPEASSLTVFVVLVLGFGALVMCARRKRAATD
jgi:hypothetical protein